MPFHTFRSQVPTILMVTQPKSEYNFSYSSLQLLNLIKLMPSGKVIFKVGFLSADIRARLLLLTLIPSIAILGSSTPWPQIDFNSDIYDKKIEIEFLDYVRKAEKFNSLDELKAQITKDKDYIIKQHSR